MHRWYFMSKYLAQSGLDVHVLAPKNADYPSTNPNVQEEVENVTLLRENIWEVRRIFNKSTKTKEAETDGIFFKDKKNLSLKEKFSLWVRGNIFIPDARVPWYFQIRGFVKNYIKKHEIDVLITTGPPHSIHLNGLYAKKKTDVKWIADFRDPWTTIEYHDKMPMTAFARNKHQQLEGKVMKVADRVITVSPSWAEEFQNLGAEKVDVVYNGYEESVFDIKALSKNEKIQIAHLGTLRADRNPENLWKALHSLKDSIAFELNLYGEVSQDVRSSIENNNLTNFTTYKGQVSHQEALKAMVSSDLLLLLVNQDEKNSKGRIPAKIFEYLRSGSKILILENQEGDASKITQKFTNTRSVNYNNYEQILEAVQSLVNNKDSFTDLDQVKTYSRENQASNLSKIIHELV